VAMPVWFWLRGIFTQSEQLDHQGDLRRCRRPGRSARRFFVRGARWAASKAFETTSAGRCWRNWRSVTQSCSWPGDRWPRSRPVSLLGRLPRVALLISGQSAAQERSPAGANDCVQGNLMGLAPVGETPRVCGGRRLIQRHRIDCTTALQAIAEQDLPGGQHHPQFWTPPQGSHLLPQGKPATGQGAECGGSVSRSDLANLNAPVPMPPLRSALFRNSTRQPRLTPRLAEIRTHSEHAQAAHARGRCVSGGERQASSPATPSHGLGCAAWRIRTGQLFDGDLPRQTGLAATRPADQQGQDKQSKAATAPGLLPTAGPGFSPARF